MNIIDKFKNEFNKHFNGVTARILSGTTWVMLGSILSKVLVFVATVIVARILSKEVYGQLSIIRSTIQLFVSISAFGVGATATKFIAEYRRTDPHKAINMYYVANAFVWVMAVISCIVLMLCASSLAVIRLHQPSLVHELRIAGVILFFTLLNGAQTGTLSGFEDFKRIAKCNAIMGISEIVLLCGGAYFFGLSGAVVGFGLTYGIAWLYNSIGIRGHLSSFGLSLKDEFKKLKLSDFRVLYSFSLPIAATSWMHMIIYWWLKTAVAGTSGFEHMANYDVAEQWKSLILMIPGMVATVILPILSNVNGLAEDRKKVITTNMIINLSITGTFAVFIILFGNFLLKLYGPEYTNPWPLYILASSSIFDSISSLCGTVVISSNKAILGLVSNAVWVIMLVIAFSIFTQTDLQLENALACSYAMAAFVQSLSIFCIVKIRKMI